MAMLGHSRSRKNPMICNLCDDRLPAGGAEIDIGVLFADVRGSTALAEEIGARAFAKTLNQFYAVATEVLLRHNAMIDKLVGDEVMALFIPVLSAGGHRRMAVAAAADLLHSMSNVKVGTDPLPVGIGVHVGHAFVGKIGTQGINDFTALGDTVNTAARLQAEAAAGQIVLSEAAFREAPELFSNAQQKEVILRGRTAPLTIRIFGGTTLQ
jgi:adenylate cyclase